MAFGGWARFFENGQDGDSGYKRAIRSTRPPVIQQSPEEEGLLDSYMSRYREIMGGPSPAADRYNQHIANLPDPENYRPGIWDRIAAGLAGMSAGMRDPMEGVRTARDINERKYRRALEDYGYGAEAFGAQAELENKQRQAAIRQLDDMFNASLKQREIRNKERDTESQIDLRKYQGKNYESQIEDRGWDNRREDKLADLKETVDLGNLDVNVFESRTGRMNAVTNARNADTNFFRANNDWQLGMDKNTIDRERNANQNAFWQKQSDVAQQNADTGRMNAGTNKQNADTNAKRAVTQEKELSWRKTIDMVNAAIRNKAVDQRAAAAGQGRGAAGVTPSELTTADSLALRQLARDSQYSEFFTVEDNELRLKYPSEIEEENAGGIFSDGDPEAMQRYESFLNLLETKTNEITGKKTNPGGGGRRYEIKR